MKLSIIIPVYNNVNFTKACLNDLSKLPDDHEVIVVNNASSDGTEEVVRSFDKVTYLKNDTNEGFARACNRGYSESTGEYVCFLNNDIRVRSNYEFWTQPLLKAAEDGALVGPTGGLLDSGFNFIKETDSYIENKYFYMSGWNLTALRKTYNSLILPGEIGPFTTEFKTYFEDTDVSFRAREMSIPMKIIPVSVHHFGKMTSKKVGIAKLYQSAKIGFINKWTDRI